MQALSLPISGNWQKKKKHKRKTIKHAISNHHATAVRRDDNRNKGAEEARQTVGNKKKQNEEETYKRKYEKKTETSLISTDLSTSAEPGISSVLHSGGVSFFFFFQRLQFFGCCCCRICFWKEKKKWKARHSFLSCFVFSVPQTCSAVPTSSVPECKYLFIPRVHGATSLGFRDKEKR